MLEFYKTRAGRTFFESHVPQITDALLRIAKQLESLPLPTAAASLKRPIIDTENDDVICPECSMRNGIEVTYHTPHTCDVAAVNGDLFAGASVDSAGLKVEQVAYCGHCGTVLDPTDIEIL